MSLVNGLVKTKAVRNLLVRGVPKHNLTATDHYGYLAGCEMETIQ
jgi:hypothetical protein